MALVLYFVIMIFVSVGCFWFVGNTYGLLRRPPIYFPLGLASKMALSTVVGGLLFMIGGPILSTLIFNAEMKKRNDYSRWPSIVAGGAISVVCAVIIYYAIFAIAWKVLD
jgi:hypothetical protein